MPESLPIVNRIIADHCDNDQVIVGQMVTVNVDKVYVQDGNSPTIAILFKKYNFQGVFSKQNVGFFFDHSVLVPNSAMADRILEAKKFARELEIRVFDQGKGISHVLAIEHGWFQPQNIVLGADSHTCIGGAVQSLALGMGASDIAAAMVTGKTWLKVPETIWVTTRGKAHHAVRPKDLVLYLLAKYGQSPFLYKSIEWNGKWIESLSLDSVCSLSSLGVELGAKCVFMPPGQSRTVGLSEVGVLDPNKEIIINLEEVEPMIALPHSPKNAVPLNKAAGKKINYVFLGSCTSSRLEDLAEMAQTLDGKTVHPNVHLVITPGSQNIYIEALEQGYIKTLVKAGALITPPGCGSCVGTQGSIPPTGSNVLSTMNRNFKGRMGNSLANIYLATPIVAASTAILGQIPLLSELI